MEYIFLVLIELLVSVAFPIGFIVLIVFIAKRSKNSRPSPRVLSVDTDYNSYNNAVPREETIISNIKVTNPNFLPDTFKHYAEMVYVQYLASINERNFSKVNKYLSETFSNTHKNYINSITTAHRNINIENVNVKKITITDFTIINNIETIKISIQSSMNKYETNDVGQVLNGYRSRVVSPTDVLTFQRNSNNLFKGDSLKCPNCMGTIKSIGERCEYCGTMLKFDDNDTENWVLADVQTL